MGVPSFHLIATSPFNRSLKKIVKKNKGILNAVGHEFEILQVDPLNGTRRHDIKKLRNIREGEGQWRIRFRTYRLRYDVIAQDVILYSINDRKDAY